MRFLSYKHTSFLTVRRVLKVFSVASLTFLLTAGVLAQKPNVVYIMVDDLGYGSVNSYGADPSLVQTPSIDRLANEGMRFTDASTPSAVCSPTRYGVLMGEYPFRSDRQSGVVNINDKLLPDPDQQTVADWLKDQGYSTSAIGKWHLGFQDQSRSDDVTEWFDPLDPGPRALGFDYYFGIPHNNDDRTGAYVENESLYQLQSENIDPDPGISSYDNEYFGFDVPEMDLTTVTQTLTDKAVDWLDQQAGSSDPFFLYFNPIAVHEPTAISVSAENAGTSAAGPYGDFIHDMDDSVGQILDKLDQMGVADDTLVIFTSDNGGLIPGDTAEDEWTAINSGLSLNGPWKGDKSEIWEGGTRVPFIARLPGTVEAGSTSDTMINLTDSWATIAELVDPSTPVEAGAAQDSVSFLSSLATASTGTESRESMITASNQGVLAIRSGDWKYIEGEPADSFGGTVRGDEAFAQLYNLASDPGETSDVLDANPIIGDLLQLELDLIRDSSTYDAPIPGDLNDDGSLDMTDVAVFVAGWDADTSGMTTLQMHGMGDMNLDGTVSLSDWWIMRGAFDMAGATLPASLSFSSVPEPTSALLAAICMFACSRQRRIVKSPSKGGGGDSFDRQWKERV